MNNRQAWAYVSSAVREFSVLGYPVILGLNRILRHVERDETTRAELSRGTKPGARATANQGARDAHVGRKTGTKPPILPASKLPGAKARTLVEEQPRLPPAQLDAIRARARGRRAKP